MSKDLALRGEETNGVAIAVTAGPAALAFAQYSFNDVFGMAQAIAKSGLFPQFNTPEKAVSMMLLCQAKGLHPMQAVERYDVVQGRPSMKAQAMQAAFQEAGGRVQFDVSDDTVCDATFSHPSGGSLRVVWDMARADKAGLASKDIWRKHPGQMLRNRCVSEGVRAVLPGVVLGIYTPEETADFEPVAPPAPPRDVTPSAIPNDAPRPNRLIPPHLREGASPSLPNEEQKRREKQAALKAFVDYGNRAAELGLNVFNDEGKISKSRIHSLLHSQTGLHGEAASAQDWESAAKHLEDFAKRIQSTPVESMPAQVIEEPSEPVVPPAKTETQIEAEDDDLEDPFKE